MKSLGTVSRRAGALVLSVGLVTLAAACGSSGSSSGSSASSSSSKSITVAVAYPSPPKALLAEFTKQTGIKVTWVNIGWDDLQTKIAAAASANTYFADAADVDWSKVGEYQRTGWFFPLNKYFSAASLKSDMPQIDTFICEQGPDGDAVRLIVPGHDREHEGLRQGGHHDDADDDLRVHR